MSGHGNGVEIQIASDATNIDSHGHSSYGLLSAPPTLHRNKVRSQTPTVYHLDSARYYSFSRLEKANLLLEFTRRI